MSEQTNPTAEEEQMEQQAAEETAAESTATESTATESTEVEAAPAAENKPAPAPAKAPAPRARYDDDDDDDDYEDYEDDYEEYDEEDDGLVEREVDGPSTYQPRERGGRVKRIGNDVRVADINYKNIQLLSRFLDTRGRILSRRKTRVSAKVQRRVVTAIKRARHLALLPYTGDHSRIVRKRGR